VSLEVRCVACSELVDVPRSDAAWLQIVNGQRRLRGLRPIVVVCAGCAPEHQLSVRVGER
jgi:hypothetical protein